MTKTDATLQTERIFSPLQRIADESQDWYFTYEGLKSEILTFNAAVQLRRYYTINHARHLLGREPFTKEETDLMSHKRWQHFV